MQRLAQQLLLHLLLGQMCNNWWHPLLGTAAAAMAACRLSN